MGRWLLAVALAGYGAGNGPGARAVSTGEDDPAILLGAIAAVVGGMIAGWLAVQFYPRLRALLPGPAAFVASAAVGWVLGVGLVGLALVSVGHSMGDGFPREAWALLGTAAKAGVAGAIGLLWLSIRRRSSSSGVRR